MIFISFRKKSALCLSHFDSGSNSLIQILMEKYYCSEIVKIYFHTVYLLKICRTVHSRTDTFSPFFAARLTWLITEEKPKINRPEGRRKFFQANSAPKCYIHKNKSAHPLTCLFRYWGERNLRKQICLISLITATLRLRLPICAFL